MVNLSGESVEYCWSKRETYEIHASHRFSSTVFPVHVNITLPTTNRGRPKRRVKRFVHARVCVFSSRTNSIPSSETLKKGGRMTDPFARQSKTPQGYGGRIRESFKLLLIFEGLARTEIPRRREGSRRERDTTD